jgi:hypothetical protein
MITAVVLLALSDTIERHINLAVPALKRVAHTVVREVTVAAPTVAAIPVSVRVTH